MIRYILALQNDRIKKHGPQSTVTFAKVDAHRGNKRNEIADKLAKAGALKPEVKERNFELLRLNLTQAPWSVRIAHRTAIERGRWSQIFTLSDLNRSVFSHLHYHCNIIHR